MPHLNIEIKARTARPDALRKILESHHARFMGLDHQIDTYFKVPKGRLKLRQGTIERSLIHYERPDQAGPKQSVVSLHHPQDDASLKQVLQQALEILTVVDKKRAIYFIDNVKFHIDEVAGLGAFVEIEAIDQDGSIGPERLREQCDQYIKLLNIQSADLLDRSYSDLLISGKPC